MTLRNVLSFMLLISLSWGALPPPDRPYKILMLLPVSSKSHRNIFMPLAESLTKRGHEVTMLSNHDLDHPKIKHFRHGLREFDVDNMNLFELGKDPSIFFKFFEKTFPVIAAKLYDDPAVKDLYARRKEFDIIVINWLFNDVVYPFAHDHPFILLVTAGLNPINSASMGNLLNPAYVPNLLDTYRHPFSFVDRIKNIFFSIVGPINWRKSINTPYQTEISKRFPDLPSLLDIEANASLSLLNSHFSLGKPTPLLPNQVEIGGMHCRPAKPLPQDIEKFLSGNTPVVYMSLGSVAKSNTMPPEYKKILVDTFKKLPYKVLWKYEDTALELPKNVMIKSWMPQQDVIAHPNVKVFITHCGLLGMQEAMYHGTPMLGLPIFGDQAKNGKELEFAEIGKMLTWPTLTVEKLTNAIHELVSNSKYKENISAISAAFKDQMESPVDRAVYWTEYVIRHQGAVHLRSPELDLSWIQLLHLDILFAFYLTLYVTKRLLKGLYNFCFSSKKSKSQRKGKYKGE